MLVCINHTTISVHKPLNLYPGFPTGNDVQFACEFKGKKKGTFQPFVVDVNTAKNLHCDRSHRCRFDKNRYL